MKHITVVGSMGSKPALRTSKGTTFTNFDVLVKDHDRKGEEVTECYEVVAFGRVAATAAAPVAASRAWRRRARAPARARRGPA